MPQTKPSQALVKTEPKDLTRSARSFLAAAKSPNTIRAYQADWRHFEGWASDHDRDALAATPATVVAYLTDLSDVAKVSTLERRMAAISQAHQMAGCESPPSPPNLALLFSISYRPVEEFCIANVSKFLGYPVLPTIVRRGRARCA